MHSNNAHSRMPSRIPFRILLLAKFARDSDILTFKKSSYPPPLSENLSENTSPSTLGYDGHKFQLLRRGLGLIRRGNSSWGSACHMRVTFLI